MLIFKPGAVNFAGILSSLKPQQLQDGQFQAASSARWDTGVPIVRQGIAQVVAFPGGATTCLGAAQMSLQGTYYLFAAFVVGGQTAIYSLNLTTLVWTELTTAAATPVPTWSGTQALTAGIAAGGTRLTNVTNDVIFTAHTLPKRVIGGTAQPSADVLSVQNLEDFPLVYNPSLGAATFVSNPTENLKVFQHKPISIPSGVTQFPFFASMSAFMQVATATAVNKYSGPQNATRWVFSDTGVNPYNSGSNFCILLSATNPRDGDATAIQFPASVNLPGEQISFIIEASAAAAFDAMNNCKWQGANERLRVVPTGATNATPTRITAPLHGMTVANNGTQTNAVYIHNVNGANDGIYFAKVFDANNYDLYYDVADTLGAPGTGGVGAAPYSANIPLYTLYDSASTDPTISIPPFVTTMDAGANRAMYTYNLKGVATANRNFRYFRMTHNGAITLTYSVTILNILSAGAGLGLYGGTEFWINYRDRLSEAESKGIIGTDIGSDTLKNAGGPSVVTSGTSSTTGSKIPVSPSVLYDYRLHIPNPATQVTIYGGLQGTPNALDVYWRTSAERTLNQPPLFWNGYALYALGTSAGDHLWSLNYATGNNPTPIINIQTESSGFGALNLVDRDQRDPGIPIPSAFNIAMPRSQVVATAQERTFVFGVKDPTNNYQYGDLYVGAQNFPFRFQSIEDPDPQNLGLNVTSGTRLVFPAEKGRALLMLAAAEANASIIFLLTEQTINALGSSVGNFQLSGSGFDATGLGTRVQIAKHGTNEPFAIDQHMSILFYIDQESQIMAFSGGLPQSLSRFTVDDKTKNIPSGRRGHAQATYWKDRLYFAYTPSGGSANTRILGYNAILGMMEFDDLLPGALTVQKMIRVFDSTKAGSGQRLFIFSGDGFVYAYEEGTTEPGSTVGPLVRLTTKQYQSPNDKKWRFGYFTIMADQTANPLTCDLYYFPSGAKFTASVNLANNNAAPQTLKKEPQGKRTEVTSFSKDEMDWQGYADIYGNLPVGTTLWHIECDIDQQERAAADRSP